MSNLTDFLNENDIKPEAVVAQSDAMESYSTEDRAKNVVRAGARRSKKSYEDASAPKVGKYGRGVTMRTVKEALSGAPVSRIGRKKITRAVNAILTTKKKDPVEPAALFGESTVRKGKTK